MKKSYVISIITILLMTISFFAYNKFGNKQEIVDNKQIGIMLEDDYESETYTLSNSSNIPIDGYTFNTTKTNALCSGATFGFDDVNNKIIVNTNKSIKCNLYFDLAEAPLEQVVHYQMLYDGSIGDATLNQISDATGGWKKGMVTSGSNTTIASNPAVFNNDSMSITISSGSGYWDNYLIHNTAVSINNYTGILFKYSYSGQISNSKGAGLCLVASNTSTGFGTGYKGSEIAEIFKYEDAVTSRSETVIYSLESVTACQDCYFIPIFYVISQNMTDTLSVRELALYESDNYNTLASKINVTVSSIDDMLNNYSIQLLSNEKAVKYMLKQCTGEFMASAVTNSTFMTAYASSPYKSLIDANEHWHKFITMAQS